MRDIEPTGDRPEGPDVEPAKAVSWIGIGLFLLVRPFLALIGFVLILLSIPVGVATPFLPIGLPIGILGVVLLGRNSRWGKRWMEAILARYPGTERLAPNWLMRLVFKRDKTRFE